MELTVLGACGTYPGPGGACSGYLLRHEGFNLWMDAGHGTLSELQKHIPVSEVDAVFLSHAHPDHFVDMYPFFYSLFSRPERRNQKVPIYGPKMVQERMCRLLTRRDGKDDFDTLLPWRTFEPGDVAEVGTLRMIAFESAHSCTNVCLRIEAGGSVLTYTGDTGPHPLLEKAAAGADLFVCEASWLEEERSIPEPIHLRAREAGEIATRAGAKQLVLTHVWPHNDMTKVHEQAAAAYAGPLEIANTAMSWKLSR
jgi:ribonuclease BN (tRNA processing enzyme)